MSRRIESAELETLREGQKLVGGLRRKVYLDMTAGITAGIEEGEAMAISHASDLVAR